MLLILGVVGIMLLVSAIKIVPQQEAWIVERLGKFDSVLEPGMTIIIPVLMVFYMLRL